MKTGPNKKAYIFLIFSTLLLPCSVFASTVYIDTGHSDFFVGDTILFSVRVDSENKTINAVDGTVAMDYPADLISLVDINTSGSKFSLWPGKPFPSASNMGISFAGGSPGGLSSSNAIVFNIVLKLQKAGQIVLSPESIGVYLHDGKGTQDGVRVKNLVIDVVPKTSDARPVDDWGSLVSNDTTPPESFEIYAGQDESVFEGKKFVSFVTTDKQSDVAYYEVRENDLPPVRSDTTYVLQEQIAPVKVVVTAYDSAGNTRESLYSSTSSNYGTFSVIAILIILLLVVAIFRKMRKAKNEFAKK